jgi:hypothetical protein
MDNPRLAQELVLLGLDDAGRVAGRNPGFDFALAGAVLLDLALAGKIDVVDKRVVPLDRQRFGDAVLDEALDSIRQSRRQRRPKDWIPRLARGLRKRVLAQLVREGAVRIETVHLLRIFPSVRYPVIDPPLVAGVRRRVDAAVRGGGQPDPRTAALCSLLASASLDRRLFPDLPRRELRRRLDEIAQGNWASAAVRQAVRDVQAATAAAVTAAVAGGAAASG